MQENDMKFVVTDSNGAGEVKGGPTRVTRLKALCTPLNATLSVSFDSFDVFL